MIEKGVLVLIEESVLQGVIRECVNKVYVIRVPWPNSSASRNTFRSDREGCVSIDRGECVTGCY